MAPFVLQIFKQLRQKSKRVCAETNYKFGVNFNQVLVCSKQQASPFCTRPQPPNRIMVRINVGSLGIDVHSATYSRLELGDGRVASENMI